MTSGGAGWDEIERLLDQLLDSEAAGRPELLARVCSGDPELGAEVERILHAITRSEQFLRDQAADYASPLIAELAASRGLLPGSLVGSYEIVRELGRGGAAKVYLAQDQRHARQVAIKVPRDEIAAILGADRFLREIRFAAQLQHPNILPLYDSGESDGMVYYVMPYIEGESLRDRLRRESQLPLSDALQIAGEVADALSHSHAHGVVHRDIKPENILLSGGGGHALVADFGIARAIVAAGGERLTETGVILGTPEYLSPEQASGSQLDGRSDIYSLGCVVYEMLGGEPPFTAATPGGVLARKMVDPIPSLRTIRQELPIPVERAVYQALARLPADRFSTAQQFAAALRGDTRPLGPIQRARIEIRSWLTSMGLALLGLLFLAGPHPTTGWKSVVYGYRTGGTGLGSLRARTSDLIHLKAPRHVAIRALFLYDPAKDAWARVALDSLPSITLRRARPRQIYSSESDPVLLTMPQPVGLFWATWDEDGHRLSSAVYAGPILCQDVMLGPAPPGHVALCVPFANRAEARFVPDPAGL